MDKEVMHWKQNIPFNRLCKSLTSNCDFDLWGMRLVFGHDTLSYYCKHFWQIISKSLDLWRSYGPDTKYTFLTDYIYLWSPAVTLTLGLGEWILSMTHHLIIVNICAKYFQNPFMDKKVMVQTRNIPLNRQCWPLTPSVTLTLKVGASCCK
jgi:hypothetical protein